MQINIGPINVNLWFLGIFGAAVGAIGLAIGLYQKRRRREYEIAQEYSELVRHRATMWTALHDAYQRFLKARDSAPDKLEDLVRAAGMPPDVGNRGGRDLIKWPEEHAENLQGQQKTLWEFATLVYPARDGRTGEITDHSIVAPAMAIDFHKARGALAHFWNRAGRALAPSYFAKHYQSAAHDLLLLSWFDIALKQWTGDPDEGKVFLFKIAQAVMGDVLD